MTRFRRVYVAAYLWLCGRVAVTGPGGWRYKRQFARKPLPRGAAWVCRAGGAISVTCAAAYYVVRETSAPRWVATTLGVLSTMGFYTWVLVGIYGRERGDEIRH